MQRGGYIAAGLAINQSNLMPRESWHACFGLYIIFKKPNPLHLIQHAMDYRRSRNFRWEIFFRLNFRRVLFSSL